LRVLPGVAKRLDFHQRQILKDQAEEPDDDGEPKDLIEQVPEPIRQR
jgi:hypothetical protein